MADRFIRKPEIKHITGVSESTRRRWELAGKFPLRRQIGPNTVAYLESEVLAWIDDQSPAQSQEDA